MGSEPTGFEQASGDVVGEVAEPEGGAAEVLEPAVDGLGGAVAGAGPVEVGQYVKGPLFQCAAEGDDLAQRSGHADAEGFDQFLHQLPAGGAVGFAVGGDHVLVDRPGGFDLDVTVVGEQLVEPGPLTVGEQAGTGVQGPPGPVERVPARP